MSVPTPVIPALSAPVRTLASEMKSLKVFAGSEGWVEKTQNVDSTKEIGAKSLTGSNDNFAYTAGLTAMVRSVSNNVWPSGVDFAA